MNMQTSQKQAILLLSATLLLAGCNSGGDETSSETTTPPAPTAPKVAICNSESMTPAKMVEVFAQKPVAKELSALVLSLVDPQKQTLAGLTTAIDNVVALDGANFCELTVFLQELINDEKSEDLQPLAFTLNIILTGLNNGMTSQQISSGLVPLLNGTYGQANKSGLISSVTDLTGNLLGGSVLSPVQELLKGLLSPQTGLLSPLTKPLDELTAVDGGPLSPLTQLVNTLVNTKDQALEPLIALLNGVLGGMENGQTSLEIENGIKALDEGQLFVKSFLSNVPFYGAALAAQAPAVAPKPVVTAPPKPTNPLAGLGGGSTEAKTPILGPVLVQIPVLGPVLDGLLGGLLGGLMGLAK